jgi:phosphoglycerate dehydrogenase-like enzyme
MLKVLVTKKLQESDKQFIEKGVKGNCELIYPEEYNEKCIKDLVVDADVLLGNFITKNILDNAKKLKLIQIPWTGVDFLDFDLLKRYDFTVCNSHSNALAVAEHAIALMFDVAKKLSFHDYMLRKGIWNRIYDNTGVSPFSKKIFNSNITIVGYGSIGKKIKELLSSFNPNFNIVDKVNYESTDDNIKYFNNDNLCEALKNADFVFISVPLTDYTKNMVNEHFFNCMDERSVLINISRGEVINEKDLFNALDKKIIKGAAIDTWFNYPNANDKNVLPSKYFPFHKLDNIVMSPHRAGYIEGELPHLYDVIENLNNLATGRELINIVSIDNKY